MSRTNRGRGVVRKSRAARMLAAACVEQLETRVLLTADVPNGYRVIDRVYLEPWEVAEGVFGYSYKGQVSGLSPLTAYYVKMSGTFSIGVGSSSHVFDAEYDVTGSSPQDYVNSVDVGVKADPTYVQEQLRWSAYDDHHVYVASFTPVSTFVPLGLFWAASGPPGAISIGGGLHYLDVYAPGPLSAPPHPIDPGGLVGTARGAEGGQDGTEGISESGVRYADGSIEVPGVDLYSTGFGNHWGITRSWGNIRGLDSKSNVGDGWHISEMPYVQVVAPNVAAVIAGGRAAYYFDWDGSAYHARHGAPVTLAHETDPINFVPILRFVDSTGQQFAFFDPFSGAVVAAKRGQFKEMLDPAGNVTVATDWDSTTGAVKQVERSTGSGTSYLGESVEYTYDSGSTSHLLTSATVQRKVGSGAWTVVRSVDYDYYDGSEPFGLEDDLKLVTIRDADDDVIDQFYYRYYTEDSEDGYAHGLQFVFNPRSLARLKSALSGYQTEDDEDVAPYADLYLKYDAGQRVREVIKQGTGATSTGGLGTYTYEYRTNNDEDYSPGSNEWRTRTFETRPDDTSVLVFSNEYGQPMLKEFSGAGSNPRTWTRANYYDDDARVLIRAAPSAVSVAYTTPPSGTLGIVSDADTGKNYYLNTTGLEYLYVYETGTLAAAPGFLSSEWLRRGYSDDEPSSSNAQQLTYYEYTTHEDAGDHKICLPYATTVYSGNGTGARTTVNDYANATWYTDQYSAVTNQVKKLPFTEQAVSSNGPGGTAPTQEVYRDVYGRITWRKDAEGYLTHASYDALTGGLIEFVADAAGGGTGEPTRGGSGSALALTTTYTVDPYDVYGRPKKIVRPVTGSSSTDRVTYVVYKDAEHEVRTYRGFNSSDGSIKGPIEIQREYRPGATGVTSLYYESLTVAVAPHLTSSVPDGAETFDGGDIQSLRRDVTNNAGQLIESDEFYYTADLAYSQEENPLADSMPTNDSANGNYHATTYTYGDGGRLARVTDPTGTITALVYDDAGRLTDYKVGTSSINLLTVASYEYDEGDEGGDSNITKVTLKPDPSSFSLDRVTLNYYDWRDRLVASKDGATDTPSTEGTSVQRPITYYTYDNLDEITAVNVYDGDGVTISTTDGVPDAPTTGLSKRALIKYDEQGRIYQTAQISVDPSSGSYSDSTGLFTNFWYDQRGYLIKSKASGGLVTKAQYDGAGRLVKSFATDGAGGTSYSDASTVASDHVLSQDQYVYNLDGTVKFKTHKDRFDDASDDDALGDPTSSSGTAKARVSYAEYFYDRAGRLTDAVNLGTNGGGSALTGPVDSSVPSRSNTKLVTSYGYDDGGRPDSVTDPRGLVSKTYYDLMGRATKTVGNYVSGSPTPTASTNQTTEYTYNGLSDLLTMKATNVSGSTTTTQTTGYVYGVSTGTGGSAINSHAILSLVKYPDKSSGSPSTSSSDQESYKVNALGEPTSFVDRNGTTHAYTYDPMGRLLSDAVTLAGGSSVDGSVKRLQYAYDSAGRPYLFTSYDAASGGSVVNQVQREYNGLGQLTKEYQEHDGSVDTSTGSTGSGRVAYGYSSDNVSRPITMTYPDGTVLHYEYGTISGNQSSTYNSAISRISYLADDNSGSIGQPLEEYSYLGLGTAVKLAHPEPGVDLTYVKQGSEGNGDAGDQYAGLDRFGRVVDQRYVKVSDGSHTDRFKYGYDRDGNVLYKDVDQSTISADDGYDELYHVNDDNSGDAEGYDGLGRMTDWRRGALSASSGGGGVLDTVSTATRTQGFTLDAEGNWASSATNGSSTSRTHDKQNELTVNGSASYSYSNTGSLTGTGVATFTYDAWDRLVGITTTTGTDIYEYDALGRRVSSYNTGGATPLPVNHLYYSDSWQVVLEQTVTEDIGPGGGGDNNSTIGDSGLADVGEEGLFPTVDPGEGGNTMSVSGGGKVDGARDKSGADDGDEAGASDGDIGMTLHAFTPSGYTIANRYAYVWSPVYVDAMVMRLKDATANNSYEERKYVQHDASFNVTAVVNTSGGVDERYVYDPYGKPTILTGAWGSRSGSSYDWKYMFQGLRYDGATGLSDMRTRVYAPALGRALQADPAGYLDGTNRYQALRSSPANYVDPSGLAGIGHGGTGTGGGGDDEAHPFGLLPLEWNPERDGNGEGRVETWPDHPNPDGTWGGNSGIVLLGAATTQPTTTEAGSVNIILVPPSQIGMPWYEMSEAELRELAEKLNFPLDMEIAERMSRIGGGSDAELTIEIYPVKKADGSWGLAVRLTLKQSTGLVVDPNLDVTKGRYGHEQRHIEKNIAIVRAIAETLKKLMGSYESEEKAREAADFMRHSMRIRWERDKKGVDGGGHTGKDGDLPPGVPFDPQGTMPSKPTTKPNIR